MTAATGAAPRWWQSRRLRLFLLGGILAILLIRVGLDLWAGGRVRAVITRLDAKYAILDPSAGWPPAVPDAQNRARLVKAAAVLVVPGDGSGAMPMAQPLREFKALPGSPPVPEELRRVVAANGDALRFVDEARSLDRSHWGVDYSTLENMPPFLELRNLSNVIYTATLIELAAGRPDEASRVLDGGLVVADSLRQEPTLVAQLIRVAIALEQFDGVRRLIEQTEPSGPALAALAERLRASREVDPLAIGLLGELRYGHQMLARLDAARVGRLSPVDGSSFGTWVALVVGRPFVRMSTANYLERLDALMDHQAGPRPREPFGQDADHGWLNRRGLSTSGIERAIDTGDLFLSGLGATELGVALRRYRLDHGDYPDDLSAVVPEYLPDVPIDPFTGVPPVYGRQGGGFTLRAEAGRNHRPNYPVLDWTVVR